MGSFSLLNIGSRAMTASYAALQTTGHNIANASVQGYSRQRVELATAEGQTTVAGYLGRGVDVESVSRAHDTFLTREAASTRSLAAMDRARMESLRRLEEVFTPGELGIGHAAGQFLNAMVDLASRPADDATRQVVLARAAEAADRFKGASQRMDAIQDDLSSALRDGVVRVNALAESIARINQKVVSMRGESQAPLDLLDERDRLISQLSEKLQINTVTGEDGAMAVFIAGGRPLVMGVSTRSLSVVADPMDPQRVALAMSEGEATRILDNGFLGGGEMAGLLRFQNEDLMRGRALLGQMASALVGVVNQQQSFGLDLNGQPGGHLFFDFHDATQDGALALVQPASTNPTTAVPILEIKDARKLQAEDFTLTFVDSNWQITSSVTGQVFKAGNDPDGGGGPELAIAGVIQGPGFNVDVTGLAVADTGNRYLLQPVTYAAGLMRRVLDQSSGIAAASPVVADVGSTNQGTASIASLAMTKSGAAVTAAATSVGPVSIKFRTDGQFDVTDASGNPIPSLTSPLDWTPGSPLNIGGVEIQLNGRPAAGDTFTISKTTQPRQNNTNALALVALRETTFVGRNAAGGGGSTVTDAYASAMADVGVRVQGAVTSSQISTAVANQAELRRAADAGVNLDEEAARLLQYQQAYQASAKVLQVAQSVFDTLLQAAG